MCDNSRKLYVGHHVVYMGIYSNFTRALRNKVIYSSTSNYSYDIFIDGFNFGGPVISYKVVESKLLGVMCGKL